MDNYTNTPRAGITLVNSSVYDSGLRAYMLSIYNYMCFALIITGLVSFFTSQSQAILELMYLIENGAIIGTKPLGWLIMFAPIIMALILGFGIHKMSVSTAKTSFWVFAIVMGLSLTSIFLNYTGTSITRVFFITAATFAAMSLYGYTTKKDLSKLGSFLIMGVIGLAIASLVNIFLQSSALQFAVSVIGALVFTGLTAYDTQKLKQIYYQLSIEDNSLAKGGIMGALTLYLDFINIFVSLIQLIGERKS